MRKLYLSKGASAACTEESAFCLALRDAGVMNLNIIELSSVLPHDSAIVEQKPSFDDKDWGKKVYAIMCQKRESRSGTTAVAGVGWYVEKGGTGNGIVAEISGTDEAQVRKDLKGTLEEVSNGRYEEMRIVTKSIKCTDKPVCALVIISFGIEGWEDLAQMK